VIHFQLLSLQELTTLRQSSLKYPQEKSLLPKTPQVELYNQSINHLKADQDPNSLTASLSQIELDQVHTIMKDQNLSLRLEFHRHTFLQPKD
jgi:hypothetical protein